MVLSLSTETTFIDVIHHFPALQKLFAVVRDSRSDNRHARERETRRRRQRETHRQRRRETEIDSQGASGIGREIRRDRQRDRQTKRDTQTKAGPSNY